MSFLHAGSVTLVPPSSSSLQTHELGSLHRDSPTAAKVVFFGDDFDVAPYLLEGRLRYLVALEGQLPPAGFAADIDACAEAFVHFDYTNALP